jgi:FkbM family methyltransferase
MKFKNKFILLIAWFSRKLPLWVRRGRLLRLLYNPDKRQNDYIETIISYDKDLKIHINTKSFIEWTIFFWGYFEKHVADFVKRNLPKGGVFIDVGANIGNNSLIASKIASKVIAIEPNPKILERLKQNIDLNNLKNVIVYDYAISNFIGESEFFIPDESFSNQGVASLSLRENIPMRKIKVRVTTLDELLKNEERIDLIKIDVEGHSKEVIQGAKNIIKKFKPIIIYEEDYSDKMVVLDYNDKAQLEKLGLNL